MDGDHYMSWPCRPKAISIGGPQMCLVIAWLATVFNLIIEKEKGKIDKKKDRDNAHSSNLPLAVVRVNCSGRAAV